MRRPDILDEIIDQIEPEVVPPEFIIMAKIRTEDGKEFVITGEELQDALASQKSDIVDVRVILNVKRIREMVIETTNNIFREVFGDDDI